MSLFTTLMDLIYDITLQMLNLPAGTQVLKPLDYADSPAGLKTPHTNAVFYLVNFDNTGMNRQFDNVTVENLSPILTTRTVKHVRNLGIQWQTYGDDGMEWADTIRTKLFDPDIKALFAARGISLIPNVSEATYVPEKIGQQWYKRYDLYAKFNQLVIDTTSVPAISGTDIIIEDEKGVISQCSVSVP